ncbi:MAG TPA: hypothetical protein P5056_03775 [Candidatus Paceibacterota bacterium]|nr:hypothetical protein [Candidatus Paceibacterota bacterium]
MKAIKIIVTIVLLFAAVYASTLVYKYFSIKTQEEIERDAILGALSSPVVPINEAETRAVLEAMKQTAPTEITKQEAQNLINVLKQY